MSLRQTFCCFVPSKKCSSVHDHIYNKVGKDSEPEVRQVLLTAGRTELEVDEVGYAKIVKTPRRPRTPATLEERTEALVETEPSPPTGDQMAMIARVKPYQNTKQPENPNAHYQFQDVTDDPKYQERKLPDLEGSLVEYCRIDDTKQKQPQVQMSHTVFAPRTKKWSMEPPAASARLRRPAEDGRPVGRWSGEPVPMAHIIDVDVGQPCSNAAECQCFGFRPHPWRKVCVHCKCDRNEHDVDTEKVLSVYDRLGIKQQDGMQNSARTQEMGSVSQGYTWVPPGLNRAKVEEYMNKLPNHTVPRLNSSGEKYREKQLLIQLPRQDLAISYCKHLRTAVERRIYDEFVNSRNEVALDIGYVQAQLPSTLECRKCKGILEKNTMAVMAPKLGEDAGFHPACFSCDTCEQLLVDLTYCAREDKIYCERHYAELHKPRCSACDELIFAGEYTKAMNKDWHSDHFCCWQCDTTLTGQRYILRDEHPYCIKCYEEVFANTCDECGKAIGIDSKVGRRRAWPRLQDLSYKDKHWHEECFLCSMCRFSLVDQPFGSKNERIFCSNCYDQAFATRCDGCNEIFRAGMKKMEYKGKQWHDKCFCCAMCKSPIGTRSFIPKNEEVFCSTCYEEKFATRCCKCKKVINSGGVTYKNEPWHRECFACTNCDTSLAGQRFTSKDDKPYCANCYGELFAKRCSACVKPITGIGGAKFISFEDRHWHNDCFICAQCTASLVGKGFITDGADILCPECAKARLMAANA